MILYLSTIFTAMIIVILFNILFGVSYFEYSATYVVCAVILVTAFQFAIDGLVAFVVNKMPNKWFGIHKVEYMATKKQVKFYEKLKIRKWKDKIWELGGLGGFRKNKLAYPNDPVYIERFIIESNKGIVTHRFGYIVGFLCVFILPLKYAFVICIPIACVNLILNILPVMVLKYNLPKLHVLHKWLTRKQPA